MAILVNPSKIVPAIKKIAPMASFLFKDFPPFLIFLFLKFSYKNIIVSVTILFN